MTTTPEQGPSREAMEVARGYITLGCDTTVEDDQRDLALAIDAHVAAQLAAKDQQIAALRADVACLAAEVKQSREYIDTRGGYEEHCGHLTPESKATCSMIGCRISAARAATDQRFPDGVPGAAR